MTAIQKKFTDLRQGLDDNGSAQQLIADLKKINRIDQNELKNNATQVKDHLSDILPGLIQNVMLLPSTTSVPNRQAIQSQIKDMRQKYKDYITPTLNSDLKTLMQATKTVRMNAQQKQIFQVNDQMRQAQKKTSLMVPQTINSKMNPSAPSNLEQTVQAYVPLLQQQPNMISSMQNLPRSVLFLNQYAKKSGFLGMGPSTYNKGRAYLGRYVRKQGNSQTIQIYPKNPIKNGDSPNILTNLKFHANKTINAWNGFVKSQNQLVQFTKQISTAQDRKTYVTQKIKGLTNYTFAAQVLSTLTYYYVQIPMMEFVKYNKAITDGSKDNFLANYRTGSRITTNPFLLTAQQGKQIFDSLVDGTEKEPPKIVQNIIKVLAQFTNVINQARCLDVSQYQLFKRQQAKQYFVSIGISTTKTDQMLGRKVIVGLKYRKVVIPTQNVNQQILQICNDVVKNQKLKQDVKQWAVKWGDQKLPSHDYLWNYDIK